MSLDPVEVGFLQTAQETRFGEVRRLDPELRAVVEQFEGRPFLRAQAEEIETQFHERFISRRCMAHVSEPQPGFSAPDFTRMSRKKVGGPL